MSKTLGRDPKVQQFTSTGQKIFAHQEVLRQMQDGIGRPIVTHLMPTDICNHSCAFCSVATREGDSLPLADMLGYLDILLQYGLKAVIVSGGGNPILYRCPKTGAKFDDLIVAINSRGLDVGVITNGMAMKKYPDGRTSWRSVEPSTLDLCTWIRISCSGFDHKENEVLVPDVNPSLTTLGFSYVYHDIYPEPAEKNHGKVSTLDDLLQIDGGKACSGHYDFNKAQYGRDRLPVLTEQIRELVEKHNPRYVRLLPNCLEVPKIAERCEELQRMADAINPDVVFVQYKPPSAPNVCYLGYVHPVLNSDGFVYPCDSCVLNEEAGHKFNVPWRVCHWRDVASIYEAPMRSLVDPKKLCPGCVFTKSNLLLEEIRLSSGPLPSAPSEIVHPNFV